MEKQTIAPVPSHSPGFSPQPPSVPTTSLQFPPSPPSSCGEQSPPPKALQEARPLLTPSPSAQNKVPPPQTSLSFSIANILRPDFGACTKVTKSAFTPHTPEVLRTPPKTPELNRGSDSPVDLSHKKTAASPSAFTSAVSQPKQTVTNITSVNKALLDSNSSCSTSSNTSSTTSCNNGRTRYPENPEELANPKVPQEEMVWPAWVYCTRYSDRPSSGPRSRRIKRRERNPEEKRPRTAFTSEQLSRLRVEFENNKYLTEKRRQELARELGLNESQIKIWFQNKRAKIKKVTGPKNGLAQHLMAQGLYNHSTMPVDEDDPYLN